MLGFGRLRGRGDGMRGKVEEREGKIKGFRFPRS